MKFTVPLKSRLAHGVSFDILVLCGVEVYVFSRTTAIDSNRWMSKSETSEPAKNQRGHLLYLFLKKKKKI